EFLVRPEEGRIPPGILGQRGQKLMVAPFPWKRMRASKALSRVWDSLCMYSAELVNLLGTIFPNSLNLSGEVSAICPTFSTHLARVSLFPSQVGTVSGFNFI